MKNCRRLAFAVIGLFVGCAAPCPHPGLRCQVEELPSASGRKGAIAEPELRKLIANGDHGSGLAATAKAVQAACDAVLWNLEHAGTVGFKKTVVTMKDGEWDYSTRSFEQGELAQTRESLDVAILGPGFFELELPDGTKAYTRDGSFRLRPDGRLVSAQGYVLSGVEPLSAPNGSITVESDGTVKHRGTGGESRSRLRVVDFANPSGLNVNRRGLFLETPASGRAEVVPLDDTSHPAAKLLPGYLELSNVHLVEEITSLVQLMEWRRTVRELTSLARGGAVTR